MPAKVQLCISMALFGTIGLFVRGIALPTAVIALVRAAVGALFLLGVMHLRGRKPSLSDIRRNGKTLLISGAAMGFNWILLFEAYRYTTVAVATLCYYLSAVFVVLLSPIVLRERLTPFKAGCAFAAFLGMVLVSGALESASVFSPIGIAFGLGAALLYAAVVMLNKRLSGIGSYDTTIAQLSAAALVLLPYVLLTQNVSAMHADGAGLALLFTVAVVHTGIAYALYFGSMQRIPAQTVALLSYLDPIVALLLSVFVLHEPMTPLGAIGAVLVLVSMLVSEWKRPKKG